MPLITEISINPEVLEKLHFNRSNDRLSIWVLKDDRPRIATPEETMRQLVVAALIVQYKYPPERIACEVVIQIGINRPRADIVIFSEKQTIETIIEVKAYNATHARGQLSSYMHASGAKYGAVVIADTTSYIELNSDGQICQIHNLPIYGDYDPSKAPNIPVTVDPIAPLDSLERLSKSDALLTYKGESIKMKNNDAASLVKVKRAFLAEGLAFRISNAESKNWTERITYAIDTANIPGKKREDSLSGEERQFLEALRKINLPGTPAISLIDAVSAYIKGTDSKQKEELSNQFKISGIRIENNMILFANLIAGDLFIYTAYRENWKTLLKSLAATQGSIGTVARFSGITSRCVCLPVNLFLNQPKPVIPKNPDAD
jgi:hypothetical protein